MLRRTTHPLRLPEVFKVPYCPALNILGLVTCNILYNSHCRPMKNFCSLNEETGLQSDGSEYLLRLIAAEI